MAGHSKWANIKHRKERQDAKRGALFGKVSREISVAAKEGGGDPEFNFALRSAIQRAKEINFPAKKIKDAVRAALEPGGANFESVLYEAYCPGGVGVLIEVLTDNKNRALGEVRGTLTKRNARLATAGSVSYGFKRLAAVRVGRVLSETEVLEALLDGGVEDYDSVERDSDGTLVLLPLECMEGAVDALSTEGAPASGQLIWHSLGLVEADGATSKAVLGILEALEDLDDVQRTWTNLDIPEALLRE